MVTDNQRPITIAIAAMGGQGGGVLAEWIIKIAEHSGFLAQGTSVPGVAQRTGATVYYLELFSRSKAEEMGSDPVMALMPAPGDVDIIIAGELIEAGRAVMRGFATADRTTIIASTHREYALSEKMAMGDGRADSEKIMASVTNASKKFIGFNMAAIAEESGSIISSVLLGALAGCDALPINKDAYIEIIRNSEIAVASNLAGFEAGFKAANDITNGNVSTITAGERQERSRYQIEDIPAAQALFHIIDNEFPEALHDILTTGIIKLINYQDIAYAHTYLEHLREIHATDHKCSGEEYGYQLTNNAARYLALWMSYEDTIQVAALKIQASRFARLRDEVRARQEQIVRITEFMHPRVQEICDTMPAWLGKFMCDNRFTNKLLGLFCNRGYKIKTTSLSGFLLLYLIAGLRRWRRSTLRFKNENNRIEAWLEKIVETAPNNYNLAVEITACQRLIKGYGETHERGLKNFNTIMSQLKQVIEMDDPATIIGEMREAALADEYGALLQEKQNSFFN